MIEIENIHQLREKLESGAMVNCAIQDMDLTQLESQIMECSVSHSIFLGCQMSSTLFTYLYNRNNSVFPQLEVPFSMYRNTLYSSEDLFKGFKYEIPESYDNCYDGLVYDHYDTHRSSGDKNINLTLAHRIHDHAITDALDDVIIRLKENGKTRNDFVAIMGGHSLERTDHYYKVVAQLAKNLGKEGKVLLSGGGPGAMEATHLGARLAKASDNDLQQALEMLSVAPRYKDKLWLSSAFEVMEKFGDQSASDHIGIPTWHYGHEKPTSFPTLIAKYFDNSVREDGLLARATGGIIFAPGSAGTIQEIFQDAAQNHYLSFGEASPMIFLGKEYWMNSRPIYPLLEKLTSEEKYKNLFIGIADSAEEVHEVLLQRQKDIKEKKSPVS